MHATASEYRDAGTPIVSVIVPMYNVRQYLADCLDSILSQDLSPIQVILVDDGSTDGTADVARHYVDAHPCVEYHRIENQGLGHARNYGATFARGEWLMFPDSDDELAPHALRDLVALGERHGCDIVTGDVDRFNSVREWPNPLHRTAFRGVPEKCHISTHPSLLYDHTAWNKLFRRTFFERESLAWVEGRLYEDMPCSVPAHFLAERVAHLDQVVYRWRERDSGGPSITQRRTEPPNFQDRMHAIRLVDEFFDGHDVPDGLRLAKDAKWLTLDIPIYLDVLPEGDDAFREEVVGTVADYLSHVNPQAWALAPSAERIKCRLAQRRDVEELVRFVRWQREAGDTLRVRRRGGRILGRYPISELAADDFDMTRELARNGLHTDVKSVSFDGGALSVRASVLVPQLSQRHPSLDARLVRPDGSQALSLEVAPLRSRSPLEVRASVQHRSVAARWQPQRDWEISSPVEGLRTLAPGEYRVELAWSDASLACGPMRLAHPAPGHETRPLPVRCGDSVVAAFYGAGEELCLRVMADPNPVACVSVGDGGLVATMAGRTDARASLPHPDYGGTAARLVLEDVPYAGHPKLAADGSTLWLVAPSQKGELSANALSASVELRGLAISGTSAELILSWPHATPSPDVTTASLVGREFGTRATIPVTSSDKGSWSASIDLADPSQTATLRDDAYRIELSTADGRHFAVASVLEAHPASLNVDGYSYRLDPRGPEPLLRVTHDRAWDEGRLRELVVDRVAYPLMRLLPLRRDLVLFESFWATSVGCSPKAIYDYVDREHPEYRCVWSVRDRRIPVGGSTKVVRQGGFGYHLALARAGHLVSNVNFPDYYVKRSGQVEVQTMHGTPLKTMGIDVRSEIPNEEAAERFLATCSRWDYLVVQSRRVEEITGHCFGFGKTFLRTGYPRNDALMQRNSQQGQRALKARMGVDPSRPLVLYAPTWRARGRFDLELDIAELEARLGDRYQFALRRHYMAVPRMSGSERLGDAVDLTFGWSPEDCMLAADVVITDYSSIMFDYALLGRPMLFYCYDIESYRDELRGLYVDFEAEAPGPILHTSAEVADALSDLEGVRRRYEGRYGAFVDGFLEYESDHSSEDVFKQAFER